MLPSEGDVVEGKYRVEGMLGSGAMGSVFRAFHVLRKAPVALKFLAEDAAESEESVARFMNEAVAASQIDSEHVVKVFDVGKHDGLPFLVMELLDGHDLSAEVRAARVTKQPASVARALHVTVQVLRGLEAAHGKGIVHRDLKPANVFLVRRDGDANRVKLVDFGISKLRQPGDDISLTQTDVAMGTPMYMSPEQARSARDVDGRSDIYGATAILYELLTNRPPHEASSYNELLYRLFKEDVPPITKYRPDLPPGLAEVIHRGLEKDLTLRWQSAGELARALEPFLDGPGTFAAAPFLPAAATAAPTTRTATEPPTLPSQPLPIATRRSSKLLVGVFVAIAIAGGTTVWSAREGPSRAPAAASSSSIVPSAASSDVAPAVVSASATPSTLGASSSTPSAPSASTSAFTSASSSSKPLRPPGPKGKLDWELSQ